MQKRTNDIINSLDQMNRAEAPGFFYAGIRAKMQRQQKVNAVSFSWKPVYITAILFIFLVADISILSGTAKNADRELSSSAVSSFAQEYHLSVQNLVP